MADPTGRPRRRDNGSGRTRPEGTSAEPRHSAIAPRPSEGASDRQPSLRHGDGQWLAVIAPATPAASERGRVSRSDIAEPRLSFAAHVAGSDTALARKVPHHADVIRPPGRVTVCPPHRRNSPRPATSLDSTAGPNLGEVTVAANLDARCSMRASCSATPRPHQAAARSADAGEAERHALRHALHRETAGNRGRTRATPHRRTPRSAGGSEQWWQSQEDARR
jgi:hypothetical protein